jgi:hypothetical protein
MTPMTIPAIRPLDKSILPDDASACSPDIEPSVVAANDVEAVVARVDNGN